MVLLQQEFEANNDFVGKQTFKQLKRQEFQHVNRKGETVNSAAYIYSRTTKDGRVFGYEVFIAKVKKAGSVCFQQTLTEDTEAYPGGKSFGKAAWFCVSPQQAEEKFNGIVNPSAVIETDDEEDDSTPPVVQRQPIVVADLIIPDGEFTTVQFGQVNNLPVPGKGYMMLMTLKNAGKVVEVGRRKMTEGRGKPTNFYSKAP